MAEDKSTVELTIRDLIANMAQTEAGALFNVILLDALDNDMLALLTKIVNRDGYMNPDADNARHVGTMAMLLSIMIHQSAGGEHQACALAKSIGDYIHGMTHIHFMMDRADASPDPQHMPHVPNCAPPGTTKH